MCVVMRQCGVEWTEDTREMNRGTSSVGARTENIGPERIHCTSLTSVPILLSLLVQMRVKYRRAKDGEEDSGTSMSLSSAGGNALC